MADDDLKRLLETNGAGMRRHFDLKVERVEKKMDASVTEIRRDFDAKATETRRHFDVSAESVKKEIRIVAEAVAHLDEKLDRETESIRDEMRQGFAGTRP